MLRHLVKGLALLASTAVVVPYTVAVICNILYGWPQTRHKYRRAFSPRKVYALNYAVLQKFMLLKYAPLRMRWKSFYANADSSVVVKDISYGRNDQTLDVYFPLSRDDSHYRPVVIFIYGGSWSSGNKNMYGMLCSQLAERLNAVVCCPNYSIYPQGYIDDMIQDTVDSIVWVHENIHRYKGNKNKVMLVGHSAGAHLCAMAILELLHDERVQLPGMEGQAVSALQFKERHYSGNSNTQEGSSGSSESFAVVSDNGGDNGGLGDSTNSAAFEMLQSQAGLEEPEEEGGEEEAAATAAAAAEGARPHEVSPPKEAGEDEDEDSGDSDSIVTVKPKDIDRAASLLDYCKSIKAFVGLAGVYHIADHYGHETWRGVEDVSYMARAMYGEDHFDRFSPTVIIKTLTHTISLPRMVLMHGTEDFVVPVYSTTKFGEALSEIGADVTVRILPGCDHFDICLGLMHPSQKFHDAVMSILMETSSRIF